MIGPGAILDGIGRQGLALTLRPFLQGGLGITRLALRGPVELGAPQIEEHPARCVQAAVAIESGHQGLTAAGKNGVGLATADLAGRGRQPQGRTQLGGAGYAGAGLATDQGVEARG